MGELRQQIEDESVDRLERAEDRAMWWRYRARLVELGISVGEVVHRSENSIDFSGLYGTVKVKIIYRCGFQVGYKYTDNYEDKAGYCNAYMGDKDREHLLFELDVVKDKYDGELTCRSHLLHNPGVGRTF